MSLKRNLIDNIIDVKAKRDGLTSGGRHWSIHSATSWADYSDMLFANCCGSFTRSDSECMYKTQYRVANKMQFSKGKCTL